MPPKKQITEAMILEKAFALTRETGFERITARGLADALHCSTQPIYRAFQDMAALKTAVTKQAVAQMMWFVMEQKDDSLPDELNVFIGYVRFADREKKLFQLIFTSGVGMLGQMMTAGRQIRFDSDMLIYANGMIMMSAYQTLRRSPAEQRAMLIHAYEAFHR